MVEMRNTMLAMALLTAAVSTGCSAGPASAEGATAPSAEALFKEHRCVKCHSAPGIEGGKSDLTGVGKKHDAAWFRKYLEKEIDLDGKKHKRKFKGDDGHLKILAEWLASLKS